MTVALHTSFPLPGHPSKPPWVSQSSWSSEEASGVCYHFFFLLFGQFYLIGLLFVYNGFLFCVFILFYFTLFVCVHMFLLLFLKNSGLLFLKNCLSSKNRERRCGIGWMGR